MLEKSMEESYEEYLTLVKRRCIRRGVDTVEDNPPLDIMVEKGGGVIEKLRRVTLFD